MFHGSFFTFIQRRLVIQENTGQPTTGPGACLIGLVCFDYFFFVCLFCWFLGFGTDYRKKNIEKIEKKFTLTLGECCLSHLHNFWIFYRRFRWHFFNLSAFAFSPNRSLSQHNVVDRLENSIKCNRYVEGRQWTVMMLIKSNHFDVCGILQLLIRYIVVTLRCECLHDEYVNVKQSGRNTRKSSWLWPVWDFANLSESSLNCGSFCRSTSEEFLWHRLKLAD